MKPSVYFFFPIRAQDLSTRFREIGHTLNCFKQALQFSSCEPFQYKIHFHINGEDLISDQYFFHRRYFQRVLKHPLVLTTSSQTGKINSVNWGIRLAASENFQYFFCIDNDILFPTFSLRQILSYCTPNFDRSAIVSYKLPLVYKTSTHFQKVYSFGILTSFINNIYYKRPTGSFYCLNLSEFDCFPQNCNEGDYLDTLKVKTSDVLIYSEYPKTFDQEFERRLRLLRSSQAIKYQRINFNKDYFLNERKKKFLSNTLNSPMYLEAFNLQLNLIEKLHSAYGIEHKI